MSKFWEALFKFLGTKLALSTACHLQTDGWFEIADGKVDEMIRAFANYKKDNWDEQLVDFEVAFKLAMKSTTLCSAFFINYGIQPKLNPLKRLLSNNPTAKSFIETIHDTSRFA